MESDNSLKRLLTILEPLVWDLDDRKKYLVKIKEELENVSRLLAYTKDNVEMVGIYADQDLIISNLDKICCSKEEYKASCYLLKSEDESVKKLPQYEKAEELFNDIIGFFKLHKAELIVEIQDLKNKCERKEIEKKYYDILSSSNPFIENIEEFEDILNSYDLTNGEKVDILLKIINNNLLNYESGNK